VRERRNNVLGDGMRAIRRDGDDSGGGERNEDATRQEAIWAGDGIASGGVDGVG